MMKRKPPDDAEEVVDAEGNPRGHIRLRKPIPGNAYTGGWDVWKHGRPFKVFQTRGEALEELLPQRPKKETFEWLYSGAGKRKEAFYPRVAVALTLLNPWRELTKISGFEPGIACCASRDAFPKTTLISDER